MKLFFLRGWVLILCGMFSFGYYLLVLQNQLTKALKMTIHFACLEEQKWLVLSVLTFEPVDENL